VPKAAARAPTPEETACDLENARTSAARRAIFHRNVAAALASRRVKWGDSPQPGGAIRSTSGAKWLTLMGDS